MDLIRMSQRDLTRIEVLSEVLAGQRTVVAAGITVYIQAVRSNMDSGSEPLLGHTEAFLSSGPPLLWPL